MAQTTESKVFLHVYCLFRDTPPGDVAVFDRINFNFTVQIIESNEDKHGNVVSDSVDFVHKMDLSRARFPPPDLRRILGDYLIEIGGPGCNIEGLLATTIPPVKERIEQDANWRIESVIFCIHKPVRSEESESSEGTVLQESVEESGPIPNEDEQDSSEARVFRECKEESGGKLISAAKESIGALERIRITDECAICEKHLAESADLIRMPCSHLFHEGCIVPWLSKSKLCPRCGFAMQPPRPS